MHCTLYETALVVRFDFDRKLQQQVPDDRRLRWNLDRQMPDSWILRPLCMTSSSSRGLSNPRPRFCCSTTDSQLTQRQLAANIYQSSKSHEVPFDSEVNILARSCRRGFLYECENKEDDEVDGDAIQISTDPSALSASASSRPRIGEASHKHWRSVLNSWATRAWEGLGNLSWVQIDDTPK